MKLLAVFGPPARGIRRLSSMVFRRNPFRMWTSPRSRFDFAGAVGNGTGSSTVMAPLLWIARSFQEAPVALWLKNDDGLEAQIFDHEMIRLLRRPNPFYSGRVLWMATITDWNVDGDTYWLKIRDRGGKVRELWWAPSWMMEPKGDEQTFITHYEYRADGAGGEPVNLSPDDVVHFRNGLDPDDPRKGYAPLKSVLREVFTDDEAANFTASLLRNMGVPGVVVSPEGEGTVTKEDADYVRAYIKDNFTGDKRGEALVMTGATKVQEFGFSPEQLTLKDLRRIPEERITAVLGTPAVVVGLGAGLDRSTFTNYTEARAAAYEQAIIPPQALLAEELWFQLLPDFEPAESIWSWRVGFDLSLVRVLQEDRFNLAKRLDLGVRGGWVRVAEGRRAQGLPVTEEDEIYLRQMNLVQVPADGSAPTPLTPPKPPTPPRSPSALEEHVGSLAASVAALAARETDHVDPALLALFTEFASIARESSTAATAAAASQAEVATVLGEIAANASATPDLELAAALNAVAAAVVASSKTSPELLALLAQLAARTKRTLVYDAAGRVTGSVDEPTAEE